MRLTRSMRRSNIYLSDHCRVYDPKMEQDQYGNEVYPVEDKVIYDGRCFVSPGNMWPFETGSDVMRQGRSDVIVYVPRDVEGLNADSIIEYDGTRYEVIGYASRHTAQATIGVTARRVS